MDELPEIRDPFDVEAWLPAPIPQEEDALPRYREVAVRFAAAGGAPEDFKQPSVAFSRQFDSWEAVPHSWRDLLDRHSATLGLWRVATNRPQGRVFDPRTADLDSFDEVIDVLYVARLAELEALRRTFARDFAGAVDWHLAALDFLRHWQDHGPLLARLPGIGVQNRVLRSLIDLTHRRELPLERLESTLCHVRDMRLNDWKNSDVFKAEYVLLRNTRGPTKRERWLEIARRDHDPPPTADDVERWLRYTEIVLAWLLTGADRPRGHRALGKVRDERIVWTPTSEFLEQQGVSAPAFARAVDEAMGRESSDTLEGFLNGSDHCRVLYETTLAFLALVAHYKRHGSYPRKIATALERYDLQRPRDYLACEQWPMQYLYYKGRLEGSHVEVRGNAVTMRRSQPLLVSINDATPAGEGQEAKATEWLFPLPIARRWQFGVASLLMLTFAIAALLALFIVPARQQADTIKQIEAAGGVVYYQDIDWTGNPQGIGTWKRMFGDVLMVDLRAPTDNDLANVSRLEDTEGLTIYDPRSITEDGISHLTKMPHLTYVAFAGLEPEPKLLKRLRTALPSAHIMWQPEH